jgi:hypothetical protein
MKLKDLHGLGFDEIVNLEGSDIEGLLSDARGVIKKSRAERQAYIEHRRALALVLAEVEAVADAGYSIYLRKDVAGGLRQMPLFEEV